MTTSLHTAGVEHHADGLSHGLRRQVVAEEHTHDSVGSVSLGDLSPNAAVARTVLHSLSLYGNQIGNVPHLVDVSNTLSEVELSILSGVDSLDLDEALVAVLSNLGSRMNAMLNGPPSVAENRSLHMQSRRSIRHDNYNARKTLPLPITHSKRIVQTERRRLHLGTLPTSTNTQK